MARGMSIHIGLNNLDKVHYKDTGFRFLPSCIKDALDMKKIAEKNFKEPVPIFNEPNLILTDEKATTENITKILTAAAEGENKLESGDILLITYSGHGGQVKDLENIESDGAHETWCLFDRQLLDDEIFRLFTKFDKGVRILVISDSCFNGTITGSIELGVVDVNSIIALSSSFGFINFEGKVLDAKKHTPVSFSAEKWETDKHVLEKIGVGTAEVQLAKLGISKFKAIPESVLKAINDDEDNKKIYKDRQHKVHLELRQKVQDERKQDIRDLVKASVILISACEDWQTTKPGKTENENSKFTEVFMEVLDKGKPKTYLELHQKLWEFFDQNATTPSEIQAPNYYKIGHPNPGFEMEAPFTV